MSSISESLVDRYAFGRMVDPSRLFLGILIILAVTGSFFSGVKLVGDISIEKTLGLFLCYLFAIKLTFEPRFLKFKGFYVYIFFLFSLLLANTIGRNFQISQEMFRHLIGHAGNLILTLLIINFNRNNNYYSTLKAAFLILFAGLASYYFMELYFSRDIFVLRSLNFTFPFTRMTLVGNPNKFGRAMVIIFPVISYFYFRASGIKKSFYLSLLAGVFLLGALSFSRANTLALLLQLICLSWLARDKMLSRSVYFLFFLLACIFFIYVDLNSLFEFYNKAFLILKNTIKNFDLSVENVYPLGGIRTRQWLASFIIISQHPYWGAGQHVPELMASLGAIAYGGRLEAHVVAVHGGFLPVAVYHGLICSFFYLAFFMVIFIYFHKETRHSLAAICCFILLTGSFVSQTGSSIYSYNIFWLALGFLISAAQNEKSLYGGKDLRMET